MDAGMAAPPLWDSDGVCTVLRTDSGGDGALLHFGSELCKGIPFDLKCWPPGSGGTGGRHLVLQESTKKMFFARYFSTSKPSIL